MRRALIIACILSLCACSRPAYDESYSLIQGNAASFNLDMSDSLKYSLELLIYADDALSGDEAVLPMEVSLLSPDSLVYRGRLDIMPGNVIENNPSDVVYGKPVSRGFSPASYGKWAMTVSFLPEDIEKYSLRGVGSRLIREKE